MNMDTCQCFETILIFCSLDEDTFGGSQTIVIPISNDEYIFGGKISVHFCGSSMSYNKLTCGSKATLRCNSATRGEQADVLQTALAISGTTKFDTHGLLTERAQARREYSA